MELVIDKKWKWAAMDSDGSWFFYVDVPFIREDYWMHKISDCIYAEAFYIPPHPSWRNSLHQIIDGKLVKYVDVHADSEKVIVSEQYLELRRYSAGKLDEYGCLYCYEGGRDRWSSNGEMSSWPKWRRPTPEELAE